jgi:signal transduction histidine kinase
MRRFPIRVQILAAHLGVIALLTAPAAVAVVTLRTLNQISADLRDSRAAELQALRDRLTDCDRMLQIHAATADPDFGASAASCAADLEHSARALAVRAERLLPIEAEVLRRAAARLEGQAAGVPAATLADWESARQEIQQAVAALQSGERRLQESLARQAEEVSARAVVLLLGSTAAAVVVAIAIAFLLGRRIASPLQRLLEAARQVARGKFDGAFGGKSRPRGHDEIGDLSLEFDRMRRDLQGLARMKAEFLSVASHELRSPIAAIKCCVELLQADPEAPPGERQRRLLEQAVSQADLLSRHVDRLLDVSRIEAGRLPIEPRSLPAAAFFAAEVDAFREPAQREEINLAFAVAPGLPSRFRADPDRIGEVIRNLIENALRFTPRGGEVSVALAPEAGEALRVEVRDSGPGVPAPEIEKVFEKYHRGTMQAVRGGKGSGLGLAISRGIVEAHGGRIWCESVSQGGARFIFRLPVSGPRGAAKEPLQ